jgi:hypothetical protein
LLKELIAADPAIVDEVPDLWRALSGCGEA